MEFKGRQKIASERCCPLARPLDCTASILFSVSNELARPLLLLVFVSLDFITN